MGFKDIFKIVSRKNRNFLLNKIKIFNLGYYRLVNIRNLRSWVKNGINKPPIPYFKTKTIKAYAKKFNLRTLIETGTYDGDTIIANRRNFRKIYSIELDKKLYEKAVERCKRYSHISIEFGNSRDILPKILLNIKNPCLFWLDAHYSGQGTAKGDLDSPILNEMEVILNNPNLNHVILIDDKREFIGTNGYPTLKQLRNFVLAKRKDLLFVVKFDIIRIHRKFK